LLIGNLLLGVDLQTPDGSRSRKYRSVSMEGFGGRLRALRQVEPPGAACGWADIALTSVGTTICLDTYIAVLEY
jgi:hypothetical protein